MTSSRATEKCGAICCRPPYGVSRHDCPWRLARRYYEGGASSVYFWDIDDTSFAACVLFKKGGLTPHRLRTAVAICRPRAPPPARATADVRLLCQLNADAAQMKKLDAGNWDAIHVIEVRPEEGGQATYKLTTTIMLRIATDHSGTAGAGKLNLSGSLTRQKEAKLQCGGGAPSHVANMGRLVEDMENHMRDMLQARLLLALRPLQLLSPCGAPRPARERSALICAQTVYFGKTKSVVNDCLYKGAGGVADKQKEQHGKLTQELQAEMARRN